MKKILAAMILSVPFVTLTGCNQETSLFKKGTANSLAFEATTSLSLMSHLSTARSIQPKMATQPTEAEIQEITQYLEQIDFILMNDNQFKKESVASDREEYAYKDLITFSDFDGEAQTYALYYSSIQEKQDIDVDDDHDDDDDIDETETEVKQKIEGIAVYGDVTYDFKCKINREEEVGEKEESVTFTLYQSVNSYIRVEQEMEMEDDEYSTEYRYTIVENGTKIYDYRLDYEEEQENGKLEKEIELKLDSKKFKIKEETRDDGSYLRVKYIDSQNEIQYSILFKKVVETVNDTTVVHYEYIG